MLHSHGGVCPSRERQNQSQKRSDARRREKISARRKAKRRAMKATRDRSFSAPIPMTHREKAMAMPQSIIQDGRGRYGSSPSASSLSSLLEEPLSAIAFSTDSYRYHHHQAVGLRGRSASAPSACNPATQPLHVRSTSTGANRIHHILNHDDDDG